jgi:hypothetical protein
MSFTVERERARLSRPGDQIRRGRVDDGVDRRAAVKLALAFEARADGCIYCLLRRAEIGVICRQDAARGQRPGFTWLCFLPEQRRSPQFAADLAKAQDALRSAVETWCEAAGLTTRPRHPHRHAGQVQGWRAGE